MTVVMIHRELSFNGDHTEPRFFAIATDIKVAREVINHYLETRPGSDSFEVVNRRWRRQGEDYVLALKLVASHVREYFHCRTIEVETG